MASGALKKNYLWSTWGQQRGNLTFVQPLHLPKCESFRQRRRPHKMQRVLHGRRHRQTGPANSWESQGRYFEVWHVWPYKKIGNKSLQLGNPKNQNIRPSIRIVTEGWAQNLVSGSCLKLTLRSIKVHMNGEVAASTHVIVDMFLKAQVKNSRTSERTCCSKASWLPNQMFTHSFTTFRSQSIGSPNVFWCFRSYHELFVEFEGNLQELLLHDIQVPEIIPQCQYRGIANHETHQQTSTDREHDAERRIWHWSRCQRNANSITENEDGNGDRSKEDGSHNQWAASRKPALIINACFLDAAFLLFENAASSNKHHNLSVHVRSQRINTTSDLFSSPAKLKIACAFRSLSCWLIQILSKKILFCDRQRSKTKVVTMKPEWTHHIENKGPCDPRSKPGRRSKPTRIIIKIATKKSPKSASKAIVVRQQCQDLFPLSSMPRMPPKCRYLVTLATLNYSRSLRRIHHAKLQLCSGWLSELQDWMTSISAILLATFLELFLQSKGPFPPGPSPNYAHFYQRPIADEPTERRHRNLKKPLVRNRGGSKRSWTAQG